MSASNTGPRKRSSGILLHPVSLPGPFGVGDIGPRAIQWIDQLARARQSWWQILPLGPTGYGDSPYQCFSAFAGNPNLLSPESLFEDGWLTRADLQTELPAERVDYGQVIPFKRRLVSTAWALFRAAGKSSLHDEWDEFRQREATWLDDFGLFMALKEMHGGGSWLAWPRAQRWREPSVLAEARRELADLIGAIEFGQFLFFRQWERLRRHANDNGVRLIGDIPIFVAGDSADVWANSHLFLLDAERRPCVVAGVPPDYFSPDGQRWGNPLYDWAAHRAEGYSWWSNRLRATLRQVDLVRLDHFRGFEANWEVPATAPTAQTGRWVPGPGAELLAVLKRDLGGLPLIAEDLGVITPEVEALRCSFGLPGMRILQFGFGGAVEVRFRPHNFEAHTVAYTGTHDNDTTRGWFEQLTAAERGHTLDYVDSDGRDIAWDFIRLAWASVADLAVVPLQDVLSLGSEARMNTPARASGNWRWRFAESTLTDSLLDRLAHVTRLFERA